MQAVSLPTDATNLGTVCQYVAHHSSRTRIPSSGSLSPRRYTRNRPWSKVEADCGRSFRASGVLYQARALILSGSISMSMSISISISICNRECLWAKSSSSVHDTAAMG